MVSPRTRYGTMYGVALTTNSRVPVTRPGFKAGDSSVFRRCGQYVEPPEHGLGILRRDVLRFLLEVFFSPPGPLNPYRAATVDGCPNLFLAGEIAGVSFLE